ncbi:RluA family pseudouridine synthase [Paraconexibacter algicola]|uniref:Pseudouridine synthase n=1 Tax=Paraconexibacter algicola TaxID=2133960 RepID=A0A2T4UBE8_9ACTN|nr:RluA family pseudouridine synthase [Paraconexibacter algicola]PTL54196.1 RluA family pseudouridine synthase [Paraconexibacter algicola]
MEQLVPSDWEGERLDAFLAEPLGSRSRATRLIEAGAVTVDGAVVRKRHRVRTGERIAVDVAQDPVREPVPDDEGPPATFGVAYEDDDLLVVDKPPGVVVHPARGNRHGTLAQALAGRAAGGEEAWRAGIVHRLDKDTSGLLVVAKSDETHRALKELLQEREITREYLALVDGRPPARTGTIDAPIGRDRRVRTRMSTDSADAREARTHFELERALPASSLLRVRLETGRTHQIRVHLQAIGHPVCGDPEYGRPGLYGLDRQFLHATRLRFVHPGTGAEVDVVSPLPADLEAALARAAATA